MYYLVKFWSSLMPMPVFWGSNLYVLESLFPVSTSDFGWWYDNLVLIWGWYSPEHLEKEDIQVHVSHLVVDSHSWRGLISDQGLVDDPKVEGKSGWRWGGNRQKSSSLHRRDITWESGALVSISNLMTVLGVRNTHLELCFRSWSLRLLDQFLYVCTNYVWDYDVW